MLPNIFNHSLTNELLPRYEKLLSIAAHYHLDYNAA